MIKSIAKPKAKGGIRSRLPTSKGPPTRRTGFFAPKSIAKPKSKGATTVAGIKPPPRRSSFFSKPKPKGAPTVGGIKPPPRRSGFLSRAKPKAVPTWGGIRSHLELMARRKDPEIFRGRFPRQSAVCAKGAWKYENQDIEMMNKNNRKRRIRNNNFELNRKESENVNVWELNSVDDVDDGVTLQRPRKRRKIDVN